MASRTIRFSSVLSLAVLLTCTVAAYGLAPGFYPLSGSLPGGHHFSTPYAISRDGSTVVGAGDSPLGAEAVVWTENDGAFGLGDWLTQAARGVSADGSVVVGQTPESAGSIAFRWVKNSGLEGLGTLPGHGRSAAFDASDDGDVVVGESVLLGSHTEAVRWTEVGGIESLGLPGSAMAVSGDGSVIVGTTPGSGPFRWTESTGIELLGVLPGGSPSHGWGTDVSDDGYVTIGYASSATGTEACRWTSTDGMVGLGYLPGGNRSEAHAISDDGNTIVGSSDSSEGEQAFIWTENDGMKTLRQILVSDHGFNMDGWFLGRAYDVSSDGNVITGTGSYMGGEQVGWVAVVPEPTTLALLAMGAVAVSKKERRTTITFMLLLASVVVALSPPAALADVFDMGGVRHPDGSWTGLASLETVRVGNPGNAGELSGSSAGGNGPDRICGAVDYEYNIGKYEVTAGQYCEFLNAVAGVDREHLYSENMWSRSDGCKIERFAGSGNADDPYNYRVAADWANRPVNYVNWGDAARFANWLHNGQPTGYQNANTTESGAYNLNNETNNQYLMTIRREDTARWVIPSEDEWYKAAYHKNDGVTGNYFSYPMASDTVPSNDLETPDGGNNANFNNSNFGYGSTRYSIGSPYWRTQVGEFETSLSAYGTCDQGGNVWEWTEAVVIDNRGVRGGAWDHYYLHSSWRASCNADFEDYAQGFRVAYIPEPATLSLLTMGTVAVLQRRK